MGDAGDGAQGLGQLPTISLAWTVKAPGDFNGDGKSDVLWRELTASHTCEWLMNGFQVAGGGLWWWLSPAVDLTPGVLYARARGHDLPLDVLRPRDPKGVGVIVLHSGSWQSGAGPIRLPVVAPLLRHGYTLFTVRHGSQPSSR